MAACRRPGCPFHRETSAAPREHGFCCNACRRGEQVHTRNCTGYRWMPAAPRRPQNDGAAFKIPDHWVCGSGGILQYVGWYMFRFGYHMPTATGEAWSKIDTKIAFMKQERPLTIHVLAEDSASPLLNNAFRSINVHTRGLNAHAPWAYNMEEVTGIDLLVQAVLVRQPATAEVILDACRFIELQELDTFAFICKGATHRSCCCAILLASLVYRCARIVFSTGRTKEAARQRGMIEERVGDLSTATGI